MAENASHSELLINFVSHMSKRLKKIISLYKEIVLIIQHEHKAISDHNIELVEKIVQQKNANHLMIEEEFQEFLKIYKKFYKSTEEVQNEHKILFSNDISTCKACLSNARSLFISGSYKEKLYGHGLDDFSKIWEHLMEVLQKVQPMIEKNKTVIARLIHSYRENIRFWSKLEIEGLLPYTSSGRCQSVAESQISQLHIKV